MSWINQRRLPFTRRLAWLVAAVPAATAPAHSLSVLRGTVTIEGSMLTVRLDAKTQEDHPADKSVDHARPLLARMLIRDHEGALLPGRLGPASSARWDIPAGSRHVAMQLGPPGTSGPAHGVSLALAVRVNGATSQPVLLGGNGNVAVVPIAGTDARHDMANVMAPLDQCSGRRHAWFDPHDAGRSVRSIVQVDSKSVEIELLIPTPIVETWLPIRRARGEAVEPTEQETARRAMETFFANRFDVTLDGSGPVTPTVRVEFLDYSDHPHTSERVSRRLSAAASRIYASLRFRAMDRVDRVALDWRLFNAAVLSAHALLITLDDCRELDFTTCNSRWNWPRVPPE